VERVEGKGRREGGSFWRGELRGRRGAQEPGLARPSARVAWARRRANGAGEQRKGKGWAPRGSERRGGE
jgi:hypothetical protein